MVKGACTTVSPGELERESDPEVAEVSCTQRVGWGEWGEGVQVLRGRGGRRIGIRAREKEKGYRERDSHTQTEVDR